jgi:hypothetical protein
LFVNGARIEFCGRRGHGNSDSWELRRGQGQAQRLTRRLRRFNRGEEPPDCGTWRWLARTARRPVAAERPWAQPQARPQWRRHVVQRRAAIAARIRPRGIDPQPVAASQTIRIDTLHGPTRKVLHGAPPGGSPDHPTLTRDGRERRWDCGTIDLWCQEKSH